MGQEGGLDQAVAVDRENRGQTGILLKIYLMELANGLDRCPREGKGSIKVDSSFLT